MSSPRIGISGASGLVGSSLSRALSKQGWQVIPLVRRREQEGVYWSVTEQEIDAEGLEGLDALVHLAGENLSNGRWTDSQKAKILGSRVEGTRLVAGAVAALTAPPRVFITASAVGYYGARGEEWLDEESSPGEGFLAEVCHQWEHAAAAAESIDAVRVVKARFGIILSPDGGALDKMLPLFKMGVGGKLGDGRQYMSWITLEDVVRALLFLLDAPEISGPVNVTAPEPATNQEFTKALGRAVSRPTFLPVPGPMLKLAMGSQMADEMLLHGQRVRPLRLLDAGFSFQSTSIDEGITAALS